MTVTTTARQSAGRASDVEQIMQLLAGITRAERQETRATEKAIGISTAQLVTLRTLNRFEYASVNALAELTNTHQSSVSVVLRRLAEKGYVSRRVDARDRRRVYYAVTIEGRRDALAHADLTVRDRLASRLTEMLPENRERLLQLLDLWTMTVLGEGLEPW